MALTRRTFLHGLGASAVTAAIAPQGGMAADGADRVPAALDRVIDKAIAEKSIVGAVVMAARDGQVVYKRAAGSRDREQGAPMPLDGIFLLASVTKAYAAVAAMMLVEQKILTLDAPISRWMPDFTPRLRDGSKPPITVRQLLCHTAGFRYGLRDKADGSYRKAKVSSGIDQPGVTLEENLRRILSVPLAYPPGKGFGYSVAMDVLGAVMQKATGETLHEIVQRLICRPLGLKDTGFTVTDPSRLTVHYADAKPEPKMMTDHVRVPLGTDNGMQFAPSRIFNPDSFHSGGAGMAGSAPDLLRFLTALCQGGAPLLRPETVKAMCVNQIGTHRVEPGWGFGLGWSVLLSPKEARSPQTAGTASWGGVYGHHWFFDPASRLTLVSLTNTSFAGMAGAYPIGLRNALYVANV